MQPTSKWPVKHWRIVLAEKKQIKIEINLSHLSLAVAVAGILWVVFIR
jgi:hypothetical protein